jgi:hypothetical protein
MKPFDEFSRGGEDELLRKWDAEHDLNLNFELEIGRDVTSVSGLADEPSCWSERAG